MPASPNPPPVRSDSAPPDPEDVSPEKAIRPEETVPDSAPETEDHPTPSLPGPAATPRPKPVAVPHRVSDYMPAAAQPASTHSLPKGRPAISPASGLAPNETPAAPPLIGSESGPMLQLPPHRNKVERISDHVTGMVDDVKALAQLSTDYVQAKVATVQAKVHEVQQRVENFQYQIQTKWLLGVLALCALLLFVLMLAFGMSAAVEQLFFDGRYLLSLMIGFATTAMLLIAIGVAHMLFMQRKILRQKQVRADLGKEKAKQHAHEAE